MSLRGGRNRHTLVSCTAPAFATRSPSSDTMNERNRLQLAATHPAARKQWRKKLTARGAGPARTNAVVTGALAVRQARQAPPSVKIGPFYWPTVADWRSV